MGHVGMGSKHQINVSSSFKLRLFQRVGIGWVKERMGMGMVGNSSLEMNFHTESVADKPLHRWLAKKSLGLSRGTNPSGNAHLTKGHGSKVHVASSVAAFHFFLTSRKA